MVKREERGERGRERRAEAGRVSMMGRERDRGERGWERG